MTKILSNTRINTLGNKHVIDSNKTRKSSGLCKNKVMSKSIENIKNISTEEKQEKDKIISNIKFPDFYPPERNEVNYVKEGKFCLNLF